MFNQHLNNYANKGFHQIEGWVDSRLLEIVDFMETVPINKNGGIAEIGVHHGRFYILLNQVIELPNTSYAIDVFENQSLNIDHSGKGNRNEFENNLKLYDRHQGKNTVILPYDSTDPSYRLDNLIIPGSLKYISIDGGHTPEHVVNDLQLASKLIANQGVVIVDDITNHWWMGVVEGVCKFLLSTPTLIPFAIGNNKLFMTKLSYHNFWFEQFAVTRFATKQITFFGNKIICL